MRTGPLGESIWTFELNCCESIFVRGVRVILLVEKKGFQPNAAKEFFNVSFIGNWNKL